MRLVLILVFVVVVDDDKVDENVFSFLHILVPLTKCFFLSFLFYFLQNLIKIHSYCSPALVCSNPDLKVPGLNSFYTHIYIFIKRRLNSKNISKKKRKEKLVIKTNNKLEIFHKQDQNLRQLLLIRNYLIVLRPQHNNQKIK